jgi:hypothetical protein
LRRRCSNLGGLSNMHLNMHFSGTERTHLM